MTAPTAPSGLSAAGRRLWRGIGTTYELRPDELLLLEKACRTADDAARLERALAAGTVEVLGSMGQLRPNPLFNEVRQTRALLAALLAALKLPDPEAAKAKAQSNTERARTAARARWS